MRLSPRCRLGFAAFPFPPELRACGGKLRKRSAPAPYASIQFSASAATGADSACKGSCGFRYRIPAKSR